VILELLLKMRMRARKSPVYSYSPCYNPRQYCLECVLVVTAFRPFAAAQGFASRLRRRDNGSNTDPSPAQNAGSGLRLRARTPAKRLRLSKNAGSCCLGSRRPATTKHTVTILLCICQGEFTPKFPAETRVGLGLKPRYILNHLRHG
jgi:hypothetical protein